MNPLAQFGMLGPKEVLLACSNQDDHTIQQKLNALNLMIAKLLVRYNLSDKLQQDLLRLGEHYLIVSPEILSVLDNNTSNVLLSLGLVVRPSVFFTSFEYPDYLEIVPTEKKPGYDENQFLAFTGSAVESQLTYLLKKEPDPQKDALDLCLLNVLHAIFFGHNFRLLGSLDISFFPNMLQPAFPELERLGWNIEVDFENHLTSLVFPNDLLQAFKKGILQ